MEDVELEFEALKAIFLDDFEELKDEEDQIKGCRVVLLPNPGQEENNFGE